MKKVKFLVLGAICGFLFAGAQGTDPLGRPANDPATMNPTRPEKDIPVLSPGGVFDDLYDRYGNKYRLADLLIKESETAANSGDPGKTGGASTNASTFVTCNSGYFKLYFETGSGMDGNTTAEINRRNVMCQVFSDIAAFISSPLSSNGRKVNIFVRDIVNMGVANPATDPTAGLGSPYYSIPAIQNIGGIADNLIWQTIVSGTDAYTGVANPLVTPAAVGGNFYHGAVSFNFANPAFNWNDQLGVAPSGGQMDLYTVMLHEVVHAMGFGSLINSNGQSKIGATFPYYSRYDTYLKTGTNVPLITNNPSCANTRYRWNWNASLNPSILQPNPGSCINDFTNCGAAIKYGSINQHVYTPNCWSGGSSLSHFEDQCAPAVPGNNLYFVMSNATNAGPAYMKRYLKPEERTALCDMGYTCGSIFGNAGNLNNYNYGVGTCAGAQVAGINDGINPTTGFYSNLATVGTPITLNVLGNDRFTTGGANTFKCMEVIMGAGSLSAINGITTNYTPSQSGLHLLRYIPRDVATGREGNITYVFVYVQSANCVASSCNMVLNGGFENGVSCGQMNAGGGGPISIDCWTQAWNTPDYFVRGCVGPGTPLTLTVPTNWTTPSSDTWNNGANSNDCWLGLWGLTLYNGTEGIQSPLVSSLMPNTSYALTFWARTTSNLSTPGVGSNVIFAGATGLGAAGWGTQASLPAGYTALTTVLVQANNQWNYYNVTFTTPGSTPLSHLSIWNAQWMNGGDSYVIIDDVSIVPANSQVTFSQPPPVCQGQMLNDLNNYTSIPGGTFSGTGVTFNGSTNKYEFNSSLSTAAGTYQVIFSYTVNGCPNTLAQNFTVTPGSVSATASSTTYCTNFGGSITLNCTATPAPGVGGVYTWYPGPLTGQSQVVTPSSNTTYTVSVSYTSGCVVTSTVAIAVANNCCPQSTLGMSVLPNVINGAATISAPGVLYGNMVLNGPGMVSLTNGEFLMAPGSQITVMPGTTLRLSSAHLYACGTEMWQGIVVQDGGMVVSNPQTTNSNLIEDAMIGIDVSNITSAHAPAIFEIYNVIFNKNDIGVQLSNCMLPSVNFILYSCVFTSRDLTFTPTSWPGASTNAPDLRYAAPGATLGLASPFAMQNAPIGNLKTPYNMRPSRYGIYIDNFNNGTMVSPGVILTPPNASMFNLFDVVGTGIAVREGNLTTMNNVFQDMSQGQITTGPGAPYWLNGTGILSNISSTMNGLLELRAGPSPSQQNSDHGNRFWNVADGIIALNVMDFNIDHAIFRSTQTPAGINAFGPGAYGIYINTNRFNYIIDENEFNNVNRGIYLRTTSGLYDVGSGIQNGIYANTASIRKNYFGPEVSSSNPLLNGEYLNKAIQLYGPNGAAWNYAGNGVFIESNKINRAFQGILASEFGGVRIGINGNLIDLADDNILGNKQSGIGVDNTLGSVAITENTLTATGSANQQISLIYCDKNQGANSPWITCNDLSLAFMGFEFNDFNGGTVWMHNFMQLMERGMVLSNGGFIGPQGNPSFPIDNEWNGSWLGTDFTTYADATSVPASSPLFVNGSSPFWPGNNSGFTIGQDYNMGGALQGASGNNPCKPVGYPAPPTNKSITALSKADADAMNANWNLTVYPNPTTGALNILSKEESESLTVRISDVTGKIIYHGLYTTFNHKASLDVNAEPGIYLIQISNENHKILRKLIIESK